MSKIRITGSKKVLEVEQALNLLPKENSLFIDHTFDLAEYISYIIADKGISQKKLSILLGKNEPEISKWLTGRHNFTLRTICKLEAFLPIEIINPSIKKYLYAKKNKSNITSPIINIGNENTTINIFVLSKDVSIRSDKEISSKFSINSTRKLIIQEIATAEYGSN